MFMMFDMFFYICIFVFGLMIGSFLNCLVYRLEQEQTMQGRSYCPHCKHALAWYDLIPLLSFFTLAGRCRYCHKKISWQYPAVELATGIVFVVVINTLSLDYTFTFIFFALCLLYVVASLIALFVYDLKHYMIPDKILFPAIYVGILCRFFQGSIHNYLGAAVLAAGFFLIIYLISRGAWIGFGDVKLAILLGLVVGFPNILAALFLAFFFGAIIGIALMIAQRKGLKSQVPFGPFLIAGTVVALVWGTEIIQWYVRLFIA